MPKAKKKQQYTNYQELLQQQASAALMSISPNLRRKVEVKHKIDQILYEAKMDELNNDS